MLWGFTGKTVGSEEGCGRGVRKTEGVGRGEVG